MQTKPRGVMKKVLNNNNKKHNTSDQCCMKPNMNSKQVEISLFQQSTSEIE